MLRAKGGSLSALAVGDDRGVSRSKRLPYFGSGCCDINRRTGKADKLRWILQLVLKKKLEGGKEVFAL